MDRFSGLDLPKALQKAVDELGFEMMTPIQSKAFPAIMSGQDVLGIAQTGTGKTFAYLLPLLKLYKFTDTHTPKIMVLVPTRELVVQVTGGLEKLTKYMSVRVLGVYGGANINTQKDAVYAGVDIIVGTPGRIMDLALDNVLRIDETKKLVIDEFDEMLGLGFRVQLTSILAMLKPRRQNIFFSATMTDEVDAVLNEYFDPPLEISLAASGTPLENIRQHVYETPNFNTKLNLLEHLFDRLQMDRVLIFVNTKRIAELLHQMAEERMPGMTGVIHSNKSQAGRLQTLAEFREGTLRALITTDVMARGLDIAGISHVINFEMPEIPEQYIHRIGRTGRADNTGDAISFVTPREQEQLITAEILMNLEIPVSEIPEEVEISRELIGAEREKVKMKPAGKKPVKGQGAFQEKSAKNKKVNLGGPSKTKKKTSGSVNRNMLRERAQRKKRK